jgi:hypothetical protein
MIERTPRLLLISVLFLAGCTAAPEPAPTSTLVTPGQTDSPTPTSTPAPTTTPEEYVPMLAFASDVPLPDLYYILDNVLYEESGAPTDQEIASLADEGQLLAAYRTGDLLLVMREKGIQRLRLTDGRSELLYRFDQPAFFGDLAISGDGKKIYFDTVVDDPGAEFGMGSIVGVYDLALDTVTQLITIPENSSLLGPGTNGLALYLLYHGQDTSLTKVFVVDIQKGVVAREIEIQGDSFACLAPDGKTLAVLDLIMPADPSDPTQQVKSLLNVYDLGSLPGAAPQEFNLLDTPLHLNGNLLWSPDSQTIYFMLVSGNFWEDPTGFLPFGMWRLDIGTGATNEFSSMNIATFYLERITADGAWLLLRGPGHMVWVGAQYGEQIPLDFPENAFLVDGQ